jgi:glycerol-3-phosphate dehydrogenase (NAD(P)+)
MHTKESPVTPDDDPRDQLITILGDGQMALVASDALACAGAKCRLWSHDAEALAELGKTRRSPRLESFTLDASVETEPDIEKAVRDADLVLSAIPTPFLRDVWAPLAGKLDAELPVVSVTKGVEVRTLLTPTQIIADALAEETDRRPLAVLSGPTIAAELAERKPATMVAASAHHDLAETVQRLFNTPWLRIYTSDDPLGVEIAGAVKNVIAIAAGAVDGLDLGANAKSALLARGLAEIARLGAKLGAKPDTFWGVAGVGDLATTCFSPHGRNRSCGEALGKGQTLDEYLASTSSVVEGVKTTKSVTAWSIRLGVDMPITHAVHAVLFESVPPKEAIGMLMNRPVGEERLV